MTARPLFFGITYLSSFMDLLAGEADVGDS
jgi:hypothetical protein